MNFEVSSGAIMASDPCYDTTVWCASKIENVKNGTWVSCIVYSNEGAWGKRVSDLIATHEDVHKIHMTQWEKIDSCGVDSGQFGFFDYKYFVDHESEREWGAPGFYNECCEATHDESKGFGGNVIGNAGVVSASGYGDGSYPVYVLKDKDGLIVGVKASFLSEDEVEVEEDY